MYKKIFNLTTAILLLFLFGCKKYLEVGSPDNKIISDAVFLEDGTAASVMTAYLAKLSSDNNPDPGNLSTLFFGPGLNADELELYDPGNTYYQSFYYNAHASNQNTPNYWQSLYEKVFWMNSIIEGVNRSDKLSPIVKNHLLGEAKFIRALNYFYLVNLYGDLPLMLSINTNDNRVLPRSSKEIVYEQIEKDLIEAKTILSDDFLSANLIATTNERVRPNKWAAIALLSRVYLYEKKYTLAESFATELIAQTQHFELNTSLTDVFKKNNKEAIWQIQCTSTTDGDTGEGRTFVLPAGGPTTDGTHPVYLSNYVARAFETGDDRKSDWMSSVIVGNDTLYYSSKYKRGRYNSGGDAVEYETFFRLAEQYLIRAEARAHLNNTEGAVSDLNIIRTRARAIPTINIPNPLPNLPTSLSQIKIYAAVEQERQVELFAEMGHRWFDLKRTSGFNNPALTRADEVLPVVMQARGTTWRSTAKLYPIPQGDIQANNNIKQNPGY